MRSNYLYLFQTTFSTDLLFWVVINNLFLTTTKGMTEFNVILITMVGTFISLLIYPLVRLIIAKSKNKTSSVIGSLCYLISIILFTICKSIYGLIVAQIFYALAPPFKQSALLMLKNNLKEQGKSEDFVKWRSYGSLGYSIITAIIALISGFCFNVSPYLPMYLSIGCSVVSLILALLYEDAKEVVEEKEEAKGSLKKLFKNKIMLLVLLANIFIVGSFSFFHTKSTLLLQIVAENGHMALSRISILVSVIVLISRLIRIASNMAFPVIYKKAKKKSNIMLMISVLIEFAGICYAIGGNTNSLWTNIIFVSLGLFLVVWVRDMYVVLENKLIVSKLDEKMQKQALVLANVYGNVGRFLINAVVLIMLAYTTLEMVYVFFLGIVFLQLITGIVLSKYINDDKEVPKDNHNENLD